MWAAGRWRGGSSAAAGRPLPSSRSRRSCCWRTLASRTWRAYTSSLAGPTSSPPLTSSPASREEQRAQKLPPPCQCCRVTRPQGPSRRATSKESTRCCVLDQRQGWVRRPPSPTLALRLAIIHMHRVSHQMGPQWPGCSWCIRMVRKSLFDGEIRRSRGRKSSAYACAVQELAGNGAHRKPDADFADGGVQMHGSSHRVCCSWARGQRKRSGRYSRATGCMRRPTRSR